MNARQIINYLPVELLQKLSLEYNVDFQVKKLDGVSMFKLLLYSFLTTRETSYRVIEEIYHSISFAKVASSVKQGVKYNSIRDRLISINPSFFEAIFKECLQKFEAHLQPSSNIVSFDSTLVAASSKLLKNGMKINKKGDKRYVKFTMGFRKIPVYAAIFNDQHHLSEDIALGEAIMDYTNKDDDIIVFDRGLQSRKVLEQLCFAEYQFVTRVNPNIRYKILEELTVPTNNDLSSLAIKHDYVVQLFDKKNKPTKSFYRLIISEKEGSPLLFLTNIKDLQAYEVAHIYKERWQIEVFFKFIKQQLNFSHLLSRDEDGIRNVLYLTLISSILLTVFKNVNNYKGYKIPKIKLANQLEALLIEDIVILCGGNPQLIRTFYNSS
ncbi:IS4 family transposase [Gaoshiqia sediminis]|uniref:IS4 family transposase n=1 Tax=Gaoshiqia sediminis TaxID=2986998 RepID=A0AA42CBH6_9BACT|nr:IS4 family transposase [Gaoshiqia sediminis]MCW0485045.1 IS4 family transposase [Gaoshiqia sediminis]